MFRAFKQGAIRCGIRKCTIIVFLCEENQQKKDCSGEIEIYNLDRGLILSYLGLSSKTLDKYFTLLGKAY